VIAGPVAGVDDPAELHRRLAEGDAALAQHPDVSYYVDEVAPLVDGDAVRWVGGVAGLQKERWLQSARVLLATIRWAEPGATGVVEALGRGIPVIGSPLGVLPSLVEHGVTGYLSADEDELAGYLGQLEGIDPSTCRSAVAAWTPEAMARGYLALYDTVLRRAGR
jgi:glycosyltransferase involved in cell wall biosynthesis